MADDFHFSGGIERIVGADLAAETILQRRDDSAAIGVVLGVRRRDEQNVERETDLVAANLNVALFEHVEQAHLNALRQVGQLVDGEDAAVGTRDESVVQRELVTEVTTFGHLDGVDLTDEVGDGGIRRRQLLAETIVTVHPSDWCLVTVLSDEIACVTRHRVVGIVVDLAARDDGHPFVEKIGEAADHARLGLTPFAEEDHVVTGEQRVLELRHDGLLVTEHAREQRLPGRDALHGVETDLFFDGTRHPPGCPQFANRRGESGRLSHASTVTPHRVHLGAGSDVRSAGGQCAIESTTLVP